MVRKILSPFKLLPLGYYRLLLACWLLLPFLISFTICNTYLYLSAESFIFWFVVFLMIYYSVARLFIWVWDGFQRKSIPISGVDESKSKIIHSIRNDVTLVRGVDTNVKKIICKDGRQWMILIEDYNKFKRDCTKNSEGEVEIGGDWKFETPNDTGFLYDTNPELSIG